MARPTRVPIRSLARSRIQRSSSLVRCLSSYTTSCVHWAAGHDELDFLWARWYIDHTPDAKPPHARIVFGSVSNPIYFCVNEPILRTMSSALRKRTCPFSHDPAATNSRTVLRLGSARARSTSWSRPAVKMFLHLIINRLYLSWYLRPPIERQPVTMWT